MILIQIVKHLRNYCMVEEKPDLNEIRFDLSEGKSRKVCFYGRKVIVRYTREPTA
jgi:hypothetical protein